MNASMIVRYFKKEFITYVKILIEYQWKPNPYFGRSVFFTFNQGDVLPNSYINWLQFFTRQQVYPGIIVIIHNMITSLLYRQYKNGNIFNTPHDSY